MNRRAFVGAAAVSVAFPPALRAAESPTELRLDYAYYSPSSLVLRRVGWLEEEFRKEGTAIKWAFSAGSNRALEYLNGNGIDIGSTAGLAAVLARANGNPIRTPYISSRPEWTALVVPTASPIKTLSDLQGKKTVRFRAGQPRPAPARSICIAAWRSMAAIPFPVEPRRTEKCAASLPPPCSCCASTT